MLLKAPGAGEAVRRLDVHPRPQQLRALRGLPSSVAVLCLVCVPLPCHSGPSAHPQAVLTAQAALSTTTLLFVAENTGPGEGRGHRVRTPEVRMRIPSAPRPLHTGSSSAGCPEGPSGVPSISSALPAPTLALGGPSLWRRTQTLPRAACFRHLSGYLRGEAIKF